MEDYTHLLLKQTTEDYNNNDKLYFTYKQQGYFGIQQSKINGTFHIRYPTNSPLRAEKIDIIFSGRGMVQWNEGNRINYGEIKYFEYSSCVYNENGNEFEKGLSYSDLPFEFKIPENAPSSILPIPSKLTNHLGKARIYYSIKAVITKARKRFVLKKSKKIVEVECPIVRYVQQKETENQESVTLMKKFNDNEYSILFEKTKFNQNDNINVPLNIKFNNGKENMENLNNIKKIKISFKEYYLLKVGNKTHLVKNILSSNIINKEKLSRVDDNSFNKYFVDCKLSLYGKRIRCSTKTELINVWHQVDIDVFLKGRKKIRLFEKIVDIVNSIDEFKNRNESEEEEYDL
ncbi:hypothetical protein C1645_774275 [Glomus cerebriforme]|uniref:Arrestin-like N-terminal domain-containing protein n=1 Tax=Glomus cerebriforme TaxID=658196 RepID=A0A397SXL4_9GLOM|nr:hypothetical protein C1645_774275 [Glomus cerebriforme]